MSCTRREKREGVVCVLPDKELHWKFYRFAGDLGLAQGCREARDGEEMAESYEDGISNRAGLWRAKER